MQVGKQINNLWLVQPYASTSNDIVLGVKVVNDEAIGWLTSGFMVSLTLKHRGPQTETEQLGQI